MAKTLAQTRMLNETARRQVVVVLREIFSDPDFGLELQPKAVQRLKQSVRSKKAGRVKDLKKILERYTPHE